jgi:Phage tail tube protein, GTA-gp10
MAANGEIELAWADGQHKFNLAKLRCVLELEDKCGCGVAEISKRIQEGRWKFNDLRETLRLGLIGGGELPDKALVLVQRYVDDRPWAESLQPAMAVLFAAMIGVAGDPLEKKAETERAKAERSTATMVDSSVPSSTDSGPLSDSIRAN